MDDDVRVLGIDYSTRSVDFVVIPFDGERLEDADWKAVALVHGGELQHPVAAALQVRERLAGLLGWDSIALTYIEKPFSQNRRTLATLSVIEGAIIASLPLSVRKGALNEIDALSWKRVLTGHAKASKDDVRLCVEELGLERGLPQDACDAAGMAWAARAENQAAIRAATIGAG
jgi:Holliday junction resolvasome RuvABC endonuclease subunit